VLGLQHSSIRTVTMCAFYQSNLTNTLNRRLKTYMELKQRRNLQLLSYRDQLQNLNNLQFNYPKSISENSKYQFQLLPQ
jgi:DNA polymerase/3'-5' exonuclease PolX